LAVDFTVVVPQVEEVSHAGSSRHVAEENARRKNGWCRNLHPASHIISADTVIDFRERCIGKPSTVGEARAFLQMFSGQTHAVMTAVGFSTPDSAPTVQLIESTVTFRTLDDQSIRSYFAQVNPMDKAGAYDIDQHPELIIASYEGSRTNIMGLPRETVRTWLKEQGFLK
jgi:septum formation protein